MRKLIISFLIMISIISLGGYTIKGEENNLLKISSKDYPRVDGSTSTIPLAIALRSKITGETVEDLKLTTVHSKTTESFRALMYNTTDMLIVYAPAEGVLKEVKDANIDITMKPIGRDALVFFTNKGNPVDNLTKTQVQDIYTGKIKNWKEVGGKKSKIIAYQRDKESGSQVMMDNLVMEKNSMGQVKKEYVIDAMSEIIEVVSSYKNKKNALGYSVYYYITAFLNDNYKIKLLKANGVMPSNETIKDGSYPYTQDFYAVIRSSESKDSNTRKLFDFLTSEEGKKIITEAGYVALD